MANPENTGLVIVIADFLPLFDEQSGGLRLKTLIGMIGALGWRIIFASTWDRDALPGRLSNPDERTRYENALQEDGVFSFSYGVAELDAMLELHGNSIRYAFVSFPSVAERAIPLVRMHCPTAVIIYDMVDFHAIRMSREAHLKQDASLQQAADQMRRLEVMNARAADVTITVSMEEKAEMLSLAPTAVVDVFPNVFQTPATPPPGPAGRKDLLFVGGFWHQPNGDAVKWFVAEIWPLIRARKPLCRFQIVGSNSGDDVCALANVPGVDVVGYLPDLTEAFASARVFVAPLRYGAGVKGKVGQSLINGLPVVTTKIGAEGMRLVDGEHLLVAETPELFADAVIRLLDDDDLWRSLQEHGRHFMDDHFSITALRSKVEDIFRG